MKEKKIKQAEYARLAGIDRAVITRMVKAGRLVRAADGGIDPSNPINADFLRQRTYKQAAQEMTDSDDLDDREIAAESADERRFVEALQKATARGESVDLDLTPDELRMMARRAYHEARRIAADASMRELKLKERSGELIPAVLASSFCEVVTQTITESFVAKSPQWAIQIEQRLGLLGDGRDIVEAFLAEEIGRGIDFVKRRTLRIVADINDLQIPFDENDDVIDTKEKENTI